MVSEIQRVTLIQYGLVLQGLRRILLEPDSSRVNRRMTIRILVTVMLLCEIESIQRYHRGAIFPHLRVFRHLVMSLRDGCPWVARGRSERAIEGFILELYAYFVIVANITPYGLDEDRDVPYDPLLGSISELLTDYDTFGILFSSLHDLFSLIPVISLLSRRRLQQQGDTRIEAWQPSSTCREVKGVWGMQKAASEGPSRGWSMENHAVAEIYRHALLIYLKASMCGSVVVSGGVVVHEIQQHIAVVLPLFALVSMSSLGAILLWTTMIVCSCLIDESQQATARSNIRGCRFTTGNVEQAVELLNCLWQDPAPEAFGPYGLHYVMKKSAINFCMS
ncbi:hypothetical protein BGZ61DRAFT_376133 [Ilyonectria robusta]|uniref:uncharacterized protein n=1 Tax=Ilyonectria robusta TaxID=1079257 RepID=UPI001E8D3A99|nr:uncharacterized protein BGZ61DRAFT_376133 [Ilyonectria robusta]KAH8649537.1 hypothetical protein BGZ61DRAFT_376133 [Ilyonectria robusta]